MRAMNYQETLDYLYHFLDSERNLPRTPVEYNLPRTGALLAHLGDPQDRFPCIVVAGTKGKGSTAAMLEAVLRRAGYHTGLWSSPHLHTYRERIQVARRLISQQELIELVQQTRPQLDTFGEAFGQITTFEAGFVLALRWFAQHNVDIGIIEVGLGGTYDSANMLSPILSVITSISYDHMHILGDTLTKIAGEKAGIMRAGRPAVTGAQHPEALAALVAAAKHYDAALWQALAAPGGVDLAQPASDETLRYNGPLHPALGGAFQRDNAAIAAGAALLLRRSGWAIDDSAIATGIEEATWPGRMEIVGGAPPIVLDGAHNGDSSRRLIEALREQFGQRPITLVLGTSRDKDLPRMLPELVPHAAAVVLTRSRHPRALDDLAALKAQIAPLLSSAATPVALTDDIPEALEQARALAAPGSVICVTGSLFVVAAAREALGLPNERD